TCSQATSRKWGLALPGRPAVVSEPTPRNTREGPGAGREASTGANEAVRRGHFLLVAASASLLQPRHSRSSTRAICIRTTAALTVPGRPASVQARGSRPDARRGRLERHG